MNEFAFQIDSGNFVIYYCTSFLLRDFCWLPTFWTFNASAIKFSFTRINIRQLFDCNFEVFHAFITFHCVVTSINPARQKRSTNAENTSTGSQTSLMMNSSSSLQCPQRTIADKSSLLINTITASFSQRGHVQ